MIDATVTRFVSDSKKHKTPASQSSSEPTGQTIFPIVAIGASAGGLEAYTAFLKALPSDLGMAYVLVPHLDRLHVSAFPETPQAAKVLGLTAADFGRPITRLRLKTDLDNLEQVLLDVIAEVRPQQYRIRDSEGNLCTLRLTPYRTADNRIDGVVLNVLGPNEIGNVGCESPPAAAHAAQKRVASKTAKKAAGSKAGKNKKKL